MRELSVPSSGIRPCWLLSVTVCRSIRWPIVRGDNACRICTSFAQSEAQGDADGGVLLGRAEVITVSGCHGNELGQFTGGRWVRNVGPGDLLKESPEPRSGGD